MQIPIPAKTVFAWKEARNKLSLILLKHYSTSHRGFISRIMITSWHWNIFPITGPLWGESTYHWWIPLTKRPIIWSFDVFLVVSLNKLLNKQMRFLGSEAPWCPWDITVILEEINHIILLWRETSLELPGSQCCKFDAMFVFQKYLRWDPGNLSGVSLQLWLSSNEIFSKNK